MGENMRKTATKTHKKKEIFKRKLKFVSESNENQNQFIIINFGPNVLKLIIVFNNGILFLKKNKNTKTFWLQTSMQKRLYG